MSEFDYNSFEANIASFEDQSLELIQIIVHSITFLMVVLRLKDLRVDQ